MCRFALYLGPPVALGALLTHPARSLLEQARHSEQGHEQVNGDGCGAAWYADDAPDTPRLFRDAVPAWDSARWAYVGATQSSHCILGHVRAATSGLAVTLENCHPFVWHELAFMHNGKLPEFARLAPALREALSPRARCHVRGTTDSEHVFGLFTDHWLALDALEPLERMACAMRRTIATLEDLRRACGIDAQGFLNFAVADGSRAVVSRCSSPGNAPAHSLYVRRSASPWSPDARSVTVASEPLDRGPGWESVPHDHLVCVDAERHVVVAPLHGRAGERAA